MVRYILISISWQERFLDVGQKVQNLGPILGLVVFVVFLHRIPNCSGSRELRSPGSTSFTNAVVAELADALA